MGEETSKEARAAAPQARAGPLEESPQASEPPEGQGSPMEEDLMFMASTEQADLAASLLGWEDPLEEGTATHSSILAWETPMKRGAWPAAVHSVAQSRHD